MEELPMTASGIVRKIDELGRVVIPIELRKSLDIGKREAVEMYLENDSIKIKKYEPGCCFCGSKEKTYMFKGNKICSSCIDNL